jgi:membrane associated rhomboid family serine protease/Tfp pilus assembly protein PilF
MAICLECEKEYTPSSQGFMSATGVHPELCPECAAAAEMAACKECGREFTPPKRRPLFTRSVRSEICPECAEAAEAAFAKLMVEATPRVFITPAIIIINLIIFAAMIVSGVSPINPKIEQLLKWGADYGPVTLNGQWWRLLSCAFVHIGAAHLALNMWCLWNLGRLAERMFGNRTFLALYLLSGLGGSIASVWWNPAVVSAGASGAVFGVAGGLIVFWQLGKSSIPRAVVKQNLSSVLIFAVYNLSYGFFNSGIDNAAHIGGLVIGLALGASLQKPLTRTEGSSRLRAALAYSVVSLALLLGIGAAYKSNRLFIKLLKASSALEAGDIDKAIASYKEALEIKPDLAEARNALGGAYFKKGLHDEALAAFKQTVEVSQDPRVRAMAHYNLGLIYTIKELNEEAITSFKKAIENKPDYAEAIHNLGCAYMRIGLNDEAIAAFKQTIEASRRPDLRAKAYLNLGLIYTNTELYDEAIDSLEKSMRLQPGVPDAYGVLGDCYMGKELYEKAIGAYQRALELRPDFAEAQAGLGNAYEASGLYDQAIASYQYALKSKPDDETLRESLNRVSLKQGAGKKMKALNNGR